MDWGEPYYIVDRQSVPRVGRQADSSSLLMCKSVALVMACGHVLSAMNNRDKMNYAAKVDSIGEIN